MEDNIWSLFSEVIPGWLLVLLLIVTGIGIYGPKIIRKWIDLQRERAKAQKKIELIDGLRSISKVFTSMQRLVESQYIDRVLLIEVSNGGDMPIPGSKMYAKMVTACHEDPLRQSDMAQKYESVMIDDAYIRMCVEVQQSNGVHKVDMKNYPQCRLKDWYEGEGVEYSEVYHVYTDGIAHKMFVMSIATEKEGLNYDDIRSAINSDVNDIRTQFERYRNG